MIILKNLYETNFFEDILKLTLDNNILTIKIKENPIIENIIFTGIKADKIKKAISKNLLLKIKIIIIMNQLLKIDKNSILNNL